MQYRIQKIKKNAKLNNYRQLTYLSITININPKFYIANEIYYDLWIS